MGTERSASAHDTSAPTARISIKALGRLQVHVDDRPVHLPKQPFRCALLLYLAIERTATRDRLVSLLWPNKDRARARHSLSQTLYELKRELAAPLVMNAGETITVVDSVQIDVLDFLAALDEGNVDQAVAVYGGAFHYPSTTRQFEDWGERLYSRLERRLRLTCDEHIKTLRAAGRWNEIVALSRAWIDVDGTRDEAWHHYIEGLWKTGEPDEAVRQFDRYAEALRVADDEKVLVPLDETVDLVKRIKVDLRTQGRNRVVSAPGAPVDSDQAAGLFGFARRSGRLGFAGWTAAGLVGIAVFLLLPFEVEDALSVPLEAREIAVAPMQPLGDVPRDLESGVPSLLSDLLEQLDGIRTIDPDRYSRALSGEEFTDPAGEAVRAGRSLGATSALMGTLSAVGPLVRADVVLRSTADGATLAHASATSLPDSASALVDSLAIGLVRDLWRAQTAVPNLRVSAISSADPEALRHYMRGESHLLRSRWDSAQAAFELATKADTVFALAYFRLAESIAWANTWEGEADRKPLTAAYRHRAKLPTRERSLVVIEWWDRKGTLQAYDSVQAFLTKFEDDVEGWYQLGDVLTHGWKVRPASVRRLLEPFDRAITLEPALTRLYIHPLQITATSGDESLFRSYLARLQTSLGGEETGFEGWTEALWGTGQSVRTGLREAFETQRPNPIGPLVQGYLSHGASPPEWLLDALDRAISRSSGERSRGLIALKAEVLATLGRVRDAAAVLGSVFDEDPRNMSIAVVEASIATGISSPLLPRAVEHLEGLDHDLLATLWLSWLALDSGRTEAAASRLTSRVDHLASAEPQIAALFDGTFGWVEVQRGDTVTGVHRMERGLMANGYANSGAAPLLYAWEAMVACDPEGRTRLLERLQDSRSELEFTVPRLLLYAELLDEGGQGVMADRVRQRADRLWQDADPELASRTVAAARE